MLWKKTDLDEHEPLHGLIPLQQDNPRLQRSTQILVACVWISHCETEKKNMVGLNDEGQLYFRRVAILKLHSLWMHNNKLNDYPPVRKKLIMMEKRVNKIRKVRRERSLTNTALVTALCIGDLSCQGKPPEERKQSNCCECSLERADNICNQASLSVLFSTTVLW